MLCRRCHRQVPRGALFCSTCGSAIAGVGSALELVLADGTRLALADPISVGRAPDNSVQLDERTVSRHHARFIPDDGAAFVEDAGSSHGTFVDGKKVEGRRRLQDGMSIQIGDVEVRVERRRGESEAGKTIILRPGASLVVPAIGSSTLDTGARPVGMRPRVRSGWALKRLDAAEGVDRWVLKDLHGGTFMRMGAQEAELFELLDGTRALPELISETERRFGPIGAGRLARMLADLGEKGLLAGVQGRQEAPRTLTRRERLFQPKDYTFSGMGPWLERLYSRGGFVLFTQPALAALGFVTLAGLFSFGYLVLGRYGTPFVVANKIGFGGLVFLIGRFVVVAFHETAHGLTAASFGRKVSRAGIKRVFIFPFAFVDVSDAWFEPRRRRIAISAAGPASDFIVAGVFAIVSALLSAGTVRDIFFQLALAAYVGGFFNLNPFLDRDGYQIIVDWLKQPGLRQRSKAYVARRLAGKAVPGEEPKVVRLYGVAVLIWSFIAVGFVVLMTTRYYNRLTALAPAKVVWGVFGAFYLLMFVPVILVVARPLAQRWRSKSGEAGDGGA